MKTQNKLKQDFEYQDGFLFVKNKYSSSNKVKVGKVAGSKKANGYYQINWRGTIYLAHRLIWIYHFGDIKNGFQIDHINHDRRDNRIENLRLVTNQENMRNACLPKHNTSGVIGVRYDPSRYKWRAEIKVNQKNIHLGRYNTKQEAAKARKNAELLYGFSSTHGYSRPKLLTS